MIVYVVEIYTILNMCDTVLNDYEIYSSKEKALLDYPDSIIESNYKEADLEKQLDICLNRPFSDACILVEKTLEL